MANNDAETEEVFRRSTMNRVASSDELDRYIKVTNPSAWVVLIAALLLVGGITVWSFLAVIPVTMDTVGLTSVEYNPGNPTVVCVVDKTTASRIRETGMKAYIDGVEAKSATLDETPVSAAEVQRLLDSDYLAQSIKLDDWNYRITIEPGGDLNYTDFTIETFGGDQAHLVPVSIVTSETQPIRILLGQQN